jgi:hypothetical protein
LFSNSSVSFATGVNGFTKLPVITPKVDDFGDWKSLDGKVTLNNKITVLGFGGSSILKIEVTFNLKKKFTNGIILSKTFSLDDLSCGHRERY